jgi:hypothetical protein
MEIPEYLYHGTFSSLVPSILENGLLAVPKAWRLWPQYSDERAVYLAQSQALAYEWASQGIIRIPRDEYIRGMRLDAFNISVLQIDTSGLYPWLLSVDPYLQDGAELEYKYQGDIPPELITVVD